MTATNTDVRIGKSSAKQCVAANETVALIRDKWTILVLGALTRVESRRYVELQRAVDGISQRMLTLTLKRLEENGLVQRTIFATVPPRVDYALTPMGRSLSPPLKSLLVWATENADGMAAARAAYKKRQA